MTSSGTPRSTRRRLSDDEIAGWTTGKSFTSDWTTWHFETWDRVLAAARETPARILEIGSWEGRSALFFLNYFSRAQLTCIDTWGGNVEHALDPHFAALVPDTERRFDANVAEFTGRLEKIKGSSTDVVPELAIDGREFDIVYIDGSHRAADVFSDAALTWPLVARGGIVFFDDYEWDGMEAAKDRPKLGIDTFLKAIAGGYEELERGYQVIVRKT